MRRTHARVITMTLTLAATALAILAVAPAASAGESHPPLTKGYATFKPGHAITNCSSGTPVSVTFSFQWDARKLAGQYHVRSVMRLMRPSDGHVVLARHARAAIPAHKWGTYVHTFAVPASAAGKDVQLTLSTTQGVAYDYVNARSRILCTAPRFTPLGPKLSAPRVTCSRRKLVVTFDNRKSPIDWYYFFLQQPGGFGFGLKPGGGVDFKHVIKAHKLVRRIWPVDADSPRWTVITLSGGINKYRGSSQLAGAFGTKLSASC